MAGHFNQIYRLQCSSFILLSDTKNLPFPHKKWKKFIGRLACHADDFKRITDMFQAIFYVKQWMNRSVKNNRIFTAGIPPLLLPLAPRDFPVVVDSSSSSSSWYSISHLIVQ